MWYEKTDDLDLNFLWLVGLFVYLTAMRASGLGSVSKWQKYLKFEMFAVENYWENNSLKFILNNNR